MSTTRSAKPATCWAAIVIGGRAEWIHYQTVRRTRSEARAAYLAHWDPEYKREALKRVRIARVTVSLAAAPKGTGD